MSKAGAESGVVLTDVLVIGGGIAGCTTAYYLARDGVEVTLLEQFELNSLASGANAGSLHAQIQPEPFADYGDTWARQYQAALPFYKASISLWLLAAAELGQDLGVAQDGGLLVASSVGDMRRIEAKAAYERAAGLEIDLLDASDLRRLAPYISADAVGAGYCPIEGKVDPLRATNAFADCAREKGASIHEHSAVTAIQRGASGFDIVTERGRFHAQRVVNAAGGAAARIAALLGDRVDCETFPIQLSVSERLEPLIDHLVYSAAEMLTLKQTHAGTVVIGGGWPAVDGSNGHALVSRESLRGNLQAAVAVVPALASVGIVRSWASRVNGNSSWLPVIGELPRNPGVFVNYVPWMGFSGAPAAGRITASLVQGRPPPVEFSIDPFAP
ncbi:MAG: FAD-binding oxidoreductase [Gammaproteobacteria bacterium]|nr:FAD-binding oxidoreductase [Gammaproteobacteria bacterium]